VRRRRRWSIIIVVTSMITSSVDVTMMVSPVVTMLVIMRRRREECHCPFPENLHLLFLKKTSLLCRSLFCPILHPFSISRKSLEDAFCGQSEFKAFVCFQPMGEGSDFHEQECERGVAAIIMTTKHCRLIITILDCDPTCSNERVSLQR